MVRAESLHYELSIFCDGVMNKYPSHSPVAAEIQQEREDWFSQIWNRYICVDVEGCGEIWIEIINEQWFGKCSEFTFFTLRDFYFFEGRRWLSAVSLRFYSLCLRWTDQMNPQSLARPGEKRYDLDGALGYFQHICCWDHSLFPRHTLQAAVLKTHPSRFLLSPRLLITTEVCGSTLWLGVPLTNGIPWYLARDCIYHDQWQRVRKCCRHDQRELAVSTCLRFTRSLWSISEGMIFFSYLLHCCNRLCTFQLMGFSWWTKNFALCSSFKQVSVCV